MTGYDAPGFLSRGVVRDPARLRSKVMDRLAASLAAYVAGKGGGKDGHVPSRFKPKSAYHAERQAPVAGPAVRIAVVPFVSETRRPYAGDIVMQQMITHLASWPDLEVVEPGVVRAAMLQGRVIQEDGVSLPQLDMLRIQLGVDLVIGGTVTEYQDSAGGSGDTRVVFTVHGIDTAARRVVWTSTSYNSGRDHVYFFDRGLVRTAHGLASNMAKAIVDELRSKKHLVPGPAAAAANPK
jgi:polysaccharide biosynthesis protein PelC